MHTISIRCHVSWPETLTGMFALGILNVSGNRSAWVVWNIVEGESEGVIGGMTDTTSPSAEIIGAHPIVIAAADRNIWALIPASLELFFSKVADGNVHISGDYRQFGRMVPALLRLLVESTLWANLETVIQLCQEPI